MGAWVGSYRSRNASGSPPFWQAAPAQQLTINGTPTESAAATFTDGTPSGAVSAITQWFLAGQYVSAASSFTPSVGDAGKSLRVDRIAINPWGTTRTSSPTVTIASGSGTNTVTLFATASRTSGVTPLGVLFDYTASVSNVVQANQYANGKAWRQLYYETDFNITGAGNWANSGLPRNTQTGGPLHANYFDSGTTVHHVSVTVTVGHPWATHTASKPRAYEKDACITFNGDTYLAFVNHTPTVFATDLSAGKLVLLQTGLIQDTKIIDISTTAADTFYTGNKTTYVSPSANYAAAQAGWNTQTTIPALASNKRVVLHGNEIGYGDIDISGLTNCQVVWDGNGLRPNVGRCNISGTNNLMRGLHPSQGISGFTGIDNMALDNIVNHTDLGAVMLYWSNDVNNDSYSQCQRPFLIGNTMPPTSTAILGMYGAALSHVILDNNAGDYAQHSFRSFGTYKGVTAHNWFKGKSATNDKIAHKQHSIGYVIWPTTSATGQYATSYLVVANNVMGSTQSLDAWISDTSPENLEPTTHEGLEYIIYENNRHINGQNTSTHFLATARQHTFRGNWCDAGTFLYSKDDPTVGTDPAWRGPYLMA